MELLKYVGTLVTVEIDKNELLLMADALGHVKGSMSAADFKTIFDCEPSDASKIVDEVFLKIRSASKARGSPSPES